MNCHDAAKNVGDRFLFFTFFRQLLARFRLLFMTSSDSLAAPASALAAPPPVSKRRPPGIDLAKLLAMDLRRDEPTMKSLLSPHSRELRESAARGDITRDFAAAMAHAMEYQRAVDECAEEAERAHDIGPIALPDADSTGTHNPNRVGWRDEVLDEAEAARDARRREAQLGARRGTEQSPPPPLRRASDAGAANEECDLDATGIVVSLGRRNTLKQSGSGGGFDATTTEDRVAALRERSGLPLPHQRRGTLAPDSEGEAFAAAAAPLARRRRSSAAVAMLAEFSDVASANMSVSGRDGALGFAPTRRWSTATLGPPDVASEALWSPESSPAPERPHTTRVDEGCGEGRDSMERAQMAAVQRVRFVQPRDTAPSQLADIIAATSSVAASSDDNGTERLLLPTERGTKSLAELREEQRVLIERAESARPAYESMMARAVTLLAQQRAETQARYNLM